ncbi:MAG TPA: hypothetical protein VHM89_14345 [Acidimicrobiales bacterium]|nr:hypothetical protein [Acidimicrobiales bacterium]
MSAPFAAALLAAACFGTASVLQHTAASGARRGGALDPRVLMRLARRGPYLAGLGLDGAGFVLSAWAVRALPLFLVQAALASSLAVTSAVAALVAGESLCRAERGAVATIVVGLVLLAASAAPEHAAAGSALSTGIALAGLPVLVAAGAWVGRRPDNSRTGAALGMLAGLAFAGFGMSGRLLGASDRPTLVADPLAWALVAYVTLGLLLYGAALQRGRVTTITAACVVAETLVPAAVGVLAFGDGARAGLAALAVAGFGLTAAAALWLARQDPTPVLAAAA